MELVSVVTNQILVREFSLEKSLIEILTKCKFN